MDPGLRRDDTVFVGGMDVTGAALRRANLESLVEAQGATRAAPPLLLSADPYFDLAGEEFGRRLLLTTDTTGAEYCLRPDFTLPIVASYIADGVGEPAAFSYMGPIFRQREGGPAEFDQAGIELLAQPDGDVALDQVLTFARAALSIFGVAPDIRLGGVGLFEALLVQADMPDAWRPRIRNRFGHTEALAARHKLMLGAPIRTIRRHLNGLGEARVTFDAGFSPRLDYYTGIVFEMTGPNGDVLASGGQYDRLLERLGATAPIAASGCSVWVDRLEAEVAQ